MTILSTISAKTLRRFMLVTTALTLPVLAQATMARADLPTGGSYTIGNGQIVVNGQVMDITQASQMGLIDWTTFNVGANNTVNFNQPNSSSWTLNRVNDSSASMILGHVNANGNIMVMNQNGTVFGAGSVVNVNSLVATTGSLMNAEEIAAGSTNFKFGNMTDGAIINNGNITTQDGGMVALLGGQVTNNGTINARLGKVRIGAAEMATLSVGDGLVEMALDGETTTSGPSVVNTGSIIADGGDISIQARARKGYAGDIINLGGLVQARSIAAVNGEGQVVNRPGYVFVEGVGYHGTVNVNGTIDTSASQSTYNAPAGAIRIQGSNIDVKDTARILANNTGAGNGGTINVTGGVSTTTRANSRIEAKSANAKGGNVYVTAWGQTNFGGVVDVSGYTAGGLSYVKGLNTGLNYTGFTYAGASAPDGVGGTLWIDGNSLAIGNQSGDIMTTSHFLNQFSNGGLGQFTLNSHSQITLRDAINVSGGPNLKFWFNSNNVPGAVYRLNHRGINVGSVTIDGARYYNSVWDDYGAVQEVDINGSGRNIVAQNLTLGTRLLDADLPNVFAANTRVIRRAADDANGYVQQAHDIVDEGGRIEVVGGYNPEGNTPINITKRVNVVGIPTAGVNPILQYVRWFNPAATFSNITAWVVDVMPTVAAQGGINLTNEGGVVNFFQGFYDETVTLNKNITMNGVNPTGTLFSGIVLNNTLGTYNRILGNNVWINNGPAQRGVDITATNGNAYLGQTNYDENLVLNRDIKLFGKDNGAGILSSLFNSITFNANADLTGVQAPVVTSNAGSLQEAFDATLTNGNLRLGVALYSQVLNFNRDVNVSSLQEGGSIINEILLNSTGGRFTNTLGNVVKVFVGLGQRGVDITRTGGDVYFLGDNARYLGQTLTITKNINTHGNVLDGNNVTAIFGNINGRTRGAVVPNGAESFDRVALLPETTVVIDPSVDPGLVDPNLDPTRDLEGRGRIGGVEDLLNALAPAGPDDAEQGGPTVIRVRKGSELWRVLGCSTGTVSRQYEKVAFTKAVKRGANSVQLTSDKNDKGCPAVTVTFEPSKNKATVIRENKSQRFVDTVDLTPEQLQILLQTGVVPENAI